MIELGLEVAPVRNIVRLQPQRLLLINRNIVIFHGFPIVAGGFIYAPQNPHVFQVAELTVMDRKETKTLTNKWVMLAHGLDRQGQRIFENGQPIKEVLEEYYRNADRMGLPKVDVLLACGGKIKGGVSASNFAVPYYTFGGPVYLKNNWNPEGGLRLNVKTRAAFIGNG